MVEYGLSAEQCPASCSSSTSPARKSQSYSCRPPIGRPTDFVRSYQHISVWSTSLDIPLYRFDLTLSPFWALTQTIIRALNTTFFQYDGPNNWFFVRTSGFPASRNLCSSTRVQAVGLARPLPWLLSIIRSLGDAAHSIHNRV